MLHSRPLTFLVNWLAEAKAGKDADKVSVHLLHLTPCLQYQASSIFCLRESIMYKLYKMKQNRSQQS